ncbi:DUF6220 domain-containing protein [Paracoccus sp. 22332]|uniref:DUF6220 domain-containing protein n=1 Tax=Paracoccus sp. 22332 TaxID=3453913 RepID=UPI003F847E43
MASTAHDTLVDLERGTPSWFLWSARLLPAGLAAQFLLAGQALFGGLPWEAHVTLGMALFVPVAALLSGALSIRRLRGFNWWAGLMSLLYLLQVALAAAGPAALAFHPFNAALLLASALVLLAKIERRLRHQA